MRSLIKYSAAGLLFVGAAAVQAGVNQCDTSNARVGEGDFKLNYIWGSQYLKIGQWGKFEVDAGRTRAVHFSYAPAKNLPFSVVTANLGTDVATRKGDWKNGRVDNSYQFNSPGRFHMIARSGSFLTDHPVPQPNTHLCLVNPVNVHGEPDFYISNLSKEVLGNGSVLVTIPLSFKWADYSQAYDNNKAKRISWRVSEICREQGEHCVSSHYQVINTGETNSGDNYSVLLWRGRYTIQARIDDGVTVKTKSYDIENTDKPFSLGDDTVPPCDGCQIP